MSIHVNADDFGKSAQVNRAIRDAFAAKYIDSTTLMVNMPGVSEACDIARAEGFADRVGIHLNLTEGMPLTKSIRRNPVFCDEDGSFNAEFYHDTRLRLFMDENAMAMIREELEAQFELFLSLGFTKLHVDSHHHVHTNLPIYRVLKELGAKYKYDYIRLSRNLYHGGSVPGNLYKCLYNSGIKRLANENGQYFGSYKDYVNHFGIDETRAANRLKGATPEMIKFSSKYDIEIMVHPMYNEENILVDTEIPMNEERVLRNE